MKKALTGTLTWLACLALLAAPAGAHSRPLSYASDKTEVEVHNFNQGMVLTLLDVESKTGKNFVVGQGALVDSGNASVNAGVRTNLNSSSTAVSVTDNEVGPVALNLRLEPYYQSDSQAQGNGGGCRSPLPCWLRPSRGPLAVATDKTEVEVKNFNQGLVLTSLDLKAKTGHNFAMGEGAKVETGNASVSSTVTTGLNSNSTNVSVADGGVGPVAANVNLPLSSSAPFVGEVSGGCVTSVGPVAVNVNSGGTAVATKETEVEVSNMNSGVVVTQEKLTANTGENVAVGCQICSTNSVDANATSTPGPTSTTEVVTGNASVSTTVETTVNSNTTVVTVTK